METPNPKLADLPRPLTVQREAINDSRYSANHQGYSKNLKPLIAYFWSPFMLKKKEISNQVEKFKSNHNRTSSRSINKIQFIR